MSTPRVSFSSEAGAGARFALAYERLAASDSARSAYLDRVVRAEKARSGKHTGKRLLDPEEVEELRAMRANGKSYRALAARFQLSHEAVRDIVTGKTYRGVR